MSWAGAPGDLGAEIRGGAERGEFPYLGRLRDPLAQVRGLTQDVLLEVNGTPVSGLTNRDTLAVIRHFREPIRLKTVKPGTPALSFCRGVGGVRGGRLRSGSPTPPLIIQGNPEPLGCAGLPVNGEGWRC